MEYRGNLFGKVGRHYFPLEKSTDYVEKLEKQNNEMLEMLKKIYKIENASFGLKSFDVDRLKLELKQLIKEATEL